MSQKLKKAAKNSRSYRVNQRLNSIGDVTLADFANSACPSGKGRLKKAAVTSIEREVKHLNLNNDDRAWDEKLEEFERELVEECSEVDQRLVVKKGPRRRKKTVTESSSSSEGADYPLDIWFLLSEYIRPEDVSTFACICRSTHHVVSTAKFWFNLYKRFYMKGPKLPERLKPECMVRHYGLRACVIRALYFMYPPFVTKAKTIMGFEADPHQLIKRQCALVWHEKLKPNHWIFCFKLRQEVYSTQRNSKKPNLMELLDDVFANTEEGCKVLQVTCMNYVPTPMVLGQTLLSVSLTLDQAMRCKLQLVFGSGPRCAIEAGSIRVVLNPVMKVRVLDWWHPLYPHSIDRPQLSDSASSLTNML
ncbi:transmembrane protein fates-shifted [Lycorma delicatula]|uniref:transmembrane protein fates-shifted n=1 Tax=Lycorma delicatula TaxID=130591 RepID=UPI003F515285